MKKPMWFFSDVRDARARNRPSDNWPSELLAGMVPAVLAAAVAIVDPSLRFFSHLPGFARALRVLIATGFLGAAVFAVVSRVKSAPAAGFSSAPPRFDYRFPRAVRVMAKIMILPLCIWIGYEVYDNAPNYWIGRVDLRGYICSPDGRPAPTDTFVEAVSDFGQLVSTEPVPPDDTMDTSYCICALARNARPIL